jgi:hypothetical protein
MVVIMRRPQRFRAASILVLVLCVQALVAQTHQFSDAIGIVDRVNGRWIRPQDNKDLIRGDIIFRGQTVSIEFSDSGSISIVLFATGTVWRQACTKQNPCEGSYRPPLPAASDKGFWAFLRGYWHSEVRVPSIFAGARSIGASGPSHAVLPITKDQIDLRPALVNVTAGRYTIVLRPQDCSGDSPAESKQSATIDWKPETPTPIQALAPGLYSLELFGPARVGSAAAVLIVGEDKQRIEDIWQDVLKRSRQWGIDSGTLDDLYVATLCGLHAESRP